MDGMNESEDDILREEEMDALGLDSSDPYAQSSDTTSTSKKSKRLTSQVWNHFERYQKVIDGESFWKARCHYCKKEHNGNTTANGTGTLNRHATKCRLKHSGVRYDQPTLHFTADGKVTAWRYDPKVFRESLVQLTATCDLPINFGEHFAYKKHVQKSLNPSFQPVSARSTLRDIEEYFEKRVTEMKAVFAALQYYVALTSDIWDSRAHLDYCSVVAHYSDDTWNLQKRIIGFKLVERHKGEMISDSILDVLKAYGLVDRTISITLDNSSANSKAMRFLEGLLKSYNAGFLSHQRCACHVINLIVQAGLSALEDYVGNVRMIVSWVRVSPLRINAFKAQSVALGYKPRILDADMPIRWNSTYTMLKRAAEYKMPLSQYLMSAQMQTSSHPPAVLTFFEWDIIEKIVTFLEVFYEAKTTLSGSYFTTSPCAIHQLVLIANNIYEHQADEHIGGAVRSMKSKYLEYWATPHLLYSLAFTLDPRAKMTMFEEAVFKIQHWLGLEDDNTVKDVETSLFNLFSNYEKKFGSTTRVRGRPGPSSVNKSVAWKMLGGINSSSRLHRESGTVVQYLELKNYLHTTFEMTDELDGENLNLLQWWEAHKTKYPVLSELAKDLYSISASTVSSESAFSMAGRIVEERHSRLKPKMVEMLTIIKDWEIQDERIDNLESLEDDYLDQVDEEKDPTTLSPPDHPAHRQ